MASERSPKRLSSRVRDKDGDENRRRRPLDVSTTADSKPEAKTSSKVSVMKTSELGDPTDSATVHRSRSYLQHDGRGCTAQDSRRSGYRMSPEREKWRDSRDKDHATRRKAGSDPNGKERPGAQAGESRVSRHDRLSEAKNADPPTKKRRQFREEKLLPVSEPVGNTAPESNKVPHAINATRDAGRLKERDRSGHPVERSDSSRLYGRVRSFSNGERVERTDFPSRDRFSGGFNDGRFRGMNKFGGRQAYQPSGVREEKWKHDLYDESNRSPAKKEEDPVAKVEALLSL